MRRNEGLTHLVR